MPDLRVYWQEVRAIEGSLPEFTWLMSLEDARRGMSGGRMAEVGAAQAAQLLYSKSHRKATEDEITAHLTKEDQARRQSAQERMRRRGIAMVAVPVIAPQPAEDSKRGKAKLR